MDTLHPGFYRHFKGGLYQLIDIASHSETQEPMVVYRALYGERKLWVRPASMWNEWVERDGYAGPRFKRISSEELPQDVRPPYRPDLDRLRKLIAWSEAHTLAGPTHGVKHWHKVGLNGKLLCDDQDALVAAGAETDLPNRKVVTYFAYLHDSCREDDGHDPDHGPRAAEALLSIRETLLSDMTDDEFALLQWACRAHTAEPRTGNITVDICLDADRLDLGRVGITPDPTKMASLVGSARASAR